MEQIVRGRFAPSPSGRMHLGNLFSALLAWLSCRSSGGGMVLRIEDLDRQRCNEVHARQLEADLLCFGLDWDMGGLADDRFVQSKRTAFYEEKLALLQEKGLLYPCYCTRAQRLLASAPHGAEVFAAACPCRSGESRGKVGRSPAWKIKTPDKVFPFTDLNIGYYSENLARSSGDFLLRRSDGLFAYQLAVTADDGDMGITQVVRGQDLLSSTPRQRFLLQELDYPAPDYSHVPLLTAADGRRLSKREQDMDLGELLKTQSPEQILGRLAYWSGIVDKEESFTAKELILLFSWDKIKTVPVAVT